jgi:K+-sensing histidine kinase KdpD
MKQLQHRVERILMAVWPAALVAWLLMLTTWLKLSLPVLGHDTPFLMYFFIIGLAALASGWVLGIIMTLACAITTHVLFLEPGHPAHVAIQDLLKLTLFMLEGAMISLLVERQRRARRRHEASIRELEATRARLADSNERITHLLEEVMDKSSPGSVRHHRRD